MAELLARLDNTDPWLLVALVLLVMYLAELAWHYLDLRRANPTPTARGVSAGSGHPPPYLIPVSREDPPTGSAA